MNLNMKFNNVNTRNSDKSNCKNQMFFFVLMYISYNISS